MINKFTKVVETHKGVQNYLHAVFQGDAVNAISSGWALFRGCENEQELGEVIAGASVSMGVRVEVRRVIMDDGGDTDTDAQSIVGELLIKLDKILNSKKSQNERT